MARFRGKPRERHTLRGCHLTEVAHDQAVHFRLAGEDLQEVLFAPELARGEEEELWG